MGGDQVTAPGLGIVSDKDNLSEMDHVLKPTFALAALVDGE